ncbi:MAG: hypothetical protein ACKO0W_08950 [Planctomycetota bacterium]
MDMLETNTPRPGATTTSSSTPRTTSDGGAPLSVSAPRSTAGSPRSSSASSSSSSSSSSTSSGGGSGSSSGSSSRLAELTSRAEQAVKHLHERLVDERSIADRAARASIELEERLRLGVRMLQAFDVQIERSEQTTRGAEGAVASAEERLAAKQAEIAARLGHDLDAAIDSRIAAILDRAAQEKVEWIERELAWRFDRVREVEERIERAVNATLGWLDSEIEKRLAASAGLVERAEELASRIASQSEALERAERTAGALAGLNAEGERQIATLAARTGDATALREALGTLMHEMSAAREFVQGDLRRMRDELGWLAEKGERLTGELVEGADRANAAVVALATETRNAGPVLEELASWGPILTGSDDSRVRPIADAIAGRIRGELAVDMRGFSQALRQFASRAEGSFGSIRVEAPSPAVDPQSIARALASDFSRLAPIPEIETIRSLEPPAVGLSITGEPEIAEPGAAHA